MPKTFYDRSGRAHTVGDRKESSEDEKIIKKSPGALAERPAGTKSFKNNAKSGENRSEKSKFGEKKHSKGKKTGSPKREGRHQRDRYPEKQKSSQPWKRDERGNKFDSTDPRNKNRREAPEDTGSRSYGEKSAHRGRHGSPRTQQELQRLVGTVDKNKKGSGFLIFDRRDLEDAFIPRDQLAGLFHGDRVEVFINRRGEIEDLKVMHHRFKEIYGRIELAEDKRMGESAAWLKYERKKAAEKVYIPTLGGFKPKNGDWVRAKMIYTESKPSAEIVEVFGEDLPASEDLKMVAGEYGLIENHSAKAVAEAESFKLVVPDGDWSGTELEGREDLRHLPFMTIDGESARDFDDAVVVENLGGAGWKLWVAIADVSHYVKKGTALDDEAFERGTSVYFPERAFHMLPRALSEELCSLRPNQPRLTMAASILYDRDGIKGEVKVYNAIIESRRRATYNEIQAEYEKGQHKDLFALYKLLHKQRIERGSLDFDFPEAEIKLDEKTGEPFDCVVRMRNDSHRLIEEFMIAANESVTEWMLERELPFLYRVHEAPSVESMTKFIKLARTVGVSFKSGAGSPRPKVLAEFLKTIEGHEASGMLQNALLRSLKQAIYTAHHSEHYGLASEAYTHFTSPIRRYPDLVVHRNLRRAIAVEDGIEKPLNKAQIDSTTEDLEKTAEHTSYRERVAQEAEREANKFKQLRLMKKNLGKLFDGKITGLMEKGMFVQILSPYSEGLVPVESLMDDDYQFNEDRMILAGRRKKRTFKIGMPVKVQIMRVDLDSRQAELALEEFVQEYGAASSDEITDELEQAKEE